MEVRGEDVGELEELFLARGEFEGLEVVEYQQIIGLALGVLDDVVRRRDHEFVGGETFEVFEIRGDDILYTRPTSFQSLYDINPESPRLHVILVDPEPDRALHLIAAEYAVVPITQKGGLTIALRGVYEYIFL
jgi:hypothetical protein